MTRKEFDFSGFKAIEVKNAMKLDVRRGDNFSVAVEADDELVNEVKVELSGETLKAKLEAKWGHVGLLFKNVSAPKLVVTMPELRQVELSAASRGEIGGFTGIDSFKAELSGASKLSGDIACRELDLEAGAASQFELTGSAETAEIDLSGASSAHLDKLNAGDVKAKVAGASTLTVNMTGKLDAEISGASNLRWLGTPALGDVKVTGASSFSKK